MFRVQREIPELVTRNSLRVRVDLGDLRSLDADPAHERLIIEWSNVEHFGGSISPVTFQVVLELNTGASRGDITFNYVDVSTGEPDTNDGRSATVGIKSAGTGGAQPSSDRGNLRAGGS